jgi:hypothetical protein
MQVRADMVKTRRNTYLPALRGTEWELVHAEGILATVIRCWLSKDGRANTFLQ